MHPLHHISFRVADLAQADRSYDTAPRRAGPASSVRGRRSHRLRIHRWRRPVVPEAASGATAPGLGFLSGFRRRHRAAVHLFHAAALAHGGRSPAALRPACGEHPAAFVIDPAGHTVEAVWKPAPPPGEIACSASVRAPVSAAARPKLGLARQVASCALSCVAALAVMAWRHRIDLLADARAGLLMQLQGALLLAVTLAAWLVARRGGHGAAPGRGAAGAAAARLLGHAAAPDRPLRGRWRGNAVPRRTVARPGPPSSVVPVCDCACPHCAAGAFTPRALVIHPANTRGGPVPGLVVQHPRLLGAIGQHVLSGPAWRARG